jgi:hypothetical protein
MPYFAVLFSELADLFVAERDAENKGPDIG